jgi:hypothetical protein
MSRVPAWLLRIPIAHRDGKRNTVLAHCDGLLMIGASARSIYCGDVNPFIAPAAPSGQAPDIDGAIHEYELSTH